MSKILLISRKKCNEISRNISRSATWSIEKSIQRGIKRWKNARACISKILLKMSMDLNDMIDLNAYRFLSDGRVICNMILSKGVYI